MTAVVLIVLSLLLCGYGQGTELYIPIGQSPGVSRAGSSVIGELTKADSRTKILCVQPAIALQPLWCTNYSHVMPIYLDRSHLKRSNTIGAWKDLQVGQTVEVYPRHWIKMWVEP